CVVRFSWWGKDSRTEYTLEGLTRFESMYPDITVEPEYDSWEAYDKSFGEKLADGTCADVMQINFDWMERYSPDGSAFYDLNRLSRYIELYNYTLDDLSFGTINGKLNAIPVAFNTAIPVFDKKILEQHALDIPSTWDELFAVGRVLKKHDMCVFTLSKRHLLFVAIAWFEQTHTKKVFLADGSLALSEAEVGEMLDFARRLLAENVIYSVNGGFSRTAVQKKQVAGAVVWCNETTSFISESEKNGGKPVLGNFIMTPGATESGWYLKPAVLYAIKKDCSHPEKAAVLVNYLLNNQDFALLQKNEKGVPISNRSLTALMKSNMLESMQYTALMKIRFNTASINPMIPVMEDNAVISAFADSVFSYASGGRDRECAIRHFIEALQ
nr:ABC transporter substrate-binding protein [Treponema sp.]